MNSEFNIERNPDISQQTVDEKQDSNDLHRSGHDEGVNRLREWARQEHLEWFRYNMDPYYPTCYHYYGLDPPTYNMNQDRDHPTSYHSYDQELATNSTGNQVPIRQEPEVSVNVESESDEDDDVVEDQIPDGILVLWEMLRGDGEVDVSADENNNWNFKLQWL